MRASSQQAFRRAVLGLALLAQLLCCSGQGLQPTTSQRGSVRKVYDRIIQFTKDGTAFRNAYAPNPQAVCRLNRKSLCGATAGTDDYTKLQVATSPAEYDARVNAGPDFNPIGPAKDQRPCQTAVAFAVTAAAEAAAASALQLNGSSISLSQQDLQFCPGIPRGCYDNWDLKSGLERLVSDNETVVDYDCLPYTAAQSDDPAKLCNYRCRNEPKAIPPGKFGYTPIRDVISAQKQIRRYGSFVTRFNLYEDFFPWMTKTATSNPDAVYECPNTDKPAVDSHAVTVVGYNNNQGYWIVKNSWGPDNGNKGFFKVKYGVCGMMTWGDTFGVYFVPDQQRQMTMSSVAPASANAKSAKCYIYEAQKGDTLNKIADRAVVNLGQLLYDNVRVIRDLNKPLTGVRLRICNPDPVSVRLPGRPAPKDATKESGSGETAPKPEAPKPVTKSAVQDPPPADAAAADNATAADPVEPVVPSPSPRITSQQSTFGPAEAKILLSLKESLGNPPGLNWKEGTFPCGNTEAGVPGWNQVYCSKFGQQDRVYLLDLSSLGLTGSLTDTADLSGLGRLQAMWMSGNQLSGPLPATWYKFKNLKEIKLDMNALTGSLPDVWADLKKIRRIYLNGNRLSGSLPDSWGEKMDQLQSLFLASNNLTGSVPASWAGMVNLTSASLYDNPGLNGCLPFEWNTKAKRVKLASGPQPTDGATTLTLTGTCLCGYCKDQISSACDGTATVSPQCAAKAAANGTGLPNGTAGAGIGARAGAAGSVNPVTAPDSNSSAGDTAGDYPADDGSGTAADGTNSSNAGGPSLGPAPLTAPGTPIPTRPLAGGAARISPVSAVAPGTTTPTVPVPGAAAAGSTIVTTPGINASTTPGIAGAVVPGSSTAPASNATAPAALTAPTVAASAATPAGASSTVLSSDGPVPAVPAASSAGNVTFTAPKPTGSMADAVDAMVVPDSRKDNLMSVDSSSSSTITVSTVNVGDRKSVV